jgi:hypothetical protein
MATESDRCYSTIRLVSTRGIIPNKFKRRFKLHSVRPALYILMQKAVTLNAFRKAVPWLRRLAAGLPPRRPGFDPGPVHVGFVVDKVALG